MNLVEKSGEDVGKINFNSKCGLLKRSLEEMGEVIHGDPAGKFSAGCSAHPITDRKGKIGGFGGSFAESSQMVNLFGVKLQTKKRILVVRANLSAICCSPPSQTMQKGFVIGMIHLQVLHSPEEWSKIQNR